MLSTRIQIRTFTMCTWCACLAIGILVIGIGAATAQSISKSAKNKNPAAQAGLECIHDRPRIGSAELFIVREIDGLCVGRIAWAIVPERSALLSLTPGWCGTNECGALDLRSDTYQWDERPERFYEGQTNGPTLTIKPDNADWKQPFALITSDGRAIVHLR